MCGAEGHGAFQLYSGGRMKGELRCPKHRQFMSELNEIRDTYGLDEDQLRALFISDSEGEDSDDASSTVSDSPSSTPAQTPSSTPSSTPRVASLVSFSNIASSVSTDPVSNSSKSSGWASTVSSSNVSNLENNASGSNNGILSSTATTSMSASSTGSPSIAPLPSNFSDLNASDVSQVSGLSYTTNSIGLNSSGSKLPSSSESQVSFTSLLRRLSFQDFSSLFMASCPSQSFEFPESLDFLPPPLLKLVLEDDRFLLRTLGKGLNCVRGQISSPRVTEDVAVMTWPRNESSYQVNVLHRELLKWNRLTQHYPSHFVRLFHRVPWEISWMSKQSPKKEENYAVVVSEFSSYGTLDQYFSSMNHSSSASIPDYMFNHHQNCNNLSSKDTPRFSLLDLQSLAKQLVDGLLAAYEMKVPNLDIRPSNLLVTEGVLSSSGLTSSGLAIKYGLCRFNALKGLYRLSQSGYGGGNESVTFDKWQDPFFQQNKSQQQQQQHSSNEKEGDELLWTSHLWSLGQVLYSLGTDGQSIFLTADEVVAAQMDKLVYLRYLNRHGLQNKSPMLFDLVERMTRSSLEKRISIGSVKFHPFLWNFATRKRLIMHFAQCCSTLNSNLSSPTGNKLTEFVKKLENLAVTVVYNELWTNQMSPALVNLVQPANLATDFGYSAVALLQAIHNHLALPEALHNSVYRHLTRQQMLMAYLSQILDTDFPKLLIMIFELGSNLGEWYLDEYDEICHRFHSN